MSMRRRSLQTLGVTAAAVVLAVGPALAHDCTNASKKYAESGAQVVLASDFQTVLWTTEGVAKRIDAGVIDVATGEGFHGLIAVDLDGDGTGDINIYDVTPDGSIPHQAQFNGSPCHGVMNIGQYFAECFQG